MKAILEIDAPKSCLACPLERVFDSTHFCQITSGAINTDHCKTSRHPDCPLQVEGNWHISLDSNGEKIILCGICSEKFLKRQDVKDKINKAGEQ
jgi:hypothetical protein